MEEYTVVRESVLRIQDLVWMLPVAAGSIYVIYAVGSLLLADLKYKIGKHTNW